MSILPMLGDRDKAILNSIFNPSLPFGEGIFQEHILTEDVQEPQDFDKIKDIEKSAIEKAEAFKYEDSLLLFQEAINILPSRAATYNNRAQVHRLKGNDQEAYADLAKAIELSNGKGKAFCQALCQRGTMFKKDGKENLAKQDFQQAAKLGSQFAKQQMVEMNPYAALCNQMLSQVMQQIK